MVGYPNDQGNPNGAIPVYMGVPGGVSGAPLGYQQITGLNTAKGLTVPDGALYAEVSPGAQAVRWRDDGTAPTSNVGMPIPVGAVQRFSGPSMLAAEFIEQAASAVLNVSYYGPVS